MFKDIFVQLLQDKGITAYRLSAELGIAQSVLSNWKSGRQIPNSKYLLILSKYFGVSSEYLLGKEKSPSEKGRKINVYGRIAAGNPIDSIEDIIDEEEISTDLPGDYIALRISGDSMEPRIFNGDIVIIRLQPDVESGQTAAVLIGNECATCKKVIKRQNGIVLESLNQKYTPMYYPNKEIEELPVSIIGRVIEVRGKM